MANDIQILSTASLDASLLQRAAEQGVQLDAMSFIKVSAIDSEELAEKVVDLCYLDATVVFTSANAVKAVSDIIMSADPAWDVYCIGNATLKAVESQFRSANVVAVANNAADLAKVIIEDGEEEVVFFCGDQRMDTLPKALRENDVEVFELVVYRTELTPKSMAKEYNGILFFSPSAVNSFFASNKIKEDVVLFVIGITTADATKKYATNKVIFSETASKEALVDYAVNYFKK